MQYDLKKNPVFSAQNNAFTILRERRMGRQGIIYSDITRGGGPTHPTHTSHTSQSNHLKKALIIVKLIAHK